VSDPLETEEDKQKLLSRFSKYLSIYLFICLGVTIIIKKNGKVGTRRFGVPLWESLVDDVAMRSEIGLDIRNI
jgi:hypothetical protein